MLGKIFFFLLLHVWLPRDMYQCEEPDAEQRPCREKEGAPQSRLGDSGWSVCVQDAEMQLSSSPAKSCSTSPPAQRAGGAPGGVLAGQGFPRPGSAEGSPGGA